MDFVANLRFSQKFVFFQLFETTFHGFLRAYYPTNDHILQECDPQDYAENNDKNVKNDSGKEPLLTDVEMKGFMKNWRHPMLRWPIS